MNKKISIVIRSKNEERWIRHCILSILAQSYSNFEIILVDNNSDDNTVNFAKSLGVQKILQIENFYPGLAINMGIEISDGYFIVCLSAHCIPKSRDWLKNLIAPFDDNEKLAGVYGRQLPLSFTPPSDARDLLLVFGLDFKLQKNDYFFHNANSAIRKDIWRKYPFDSTVSNIEDRLWGKAVIEAGYQIAYTPDSAVYHHHGLHQGNQKKRLSGVISLMKNTDGEALDDLPSSLMPENLTIHAVIPFLQKCDSFLKDHSCMIKKLVNELQSSPFISKIYVCSHYKSIVPSNASWIDRSNIQNDGNLSLDELIRECLILIEKENIFPDMILYANYEYGERPKNYFDNLIHSFVKGGFDTLFPALTDYGHYWYDADGEYKPLTTELKSRINREPIYKAFYGLGTIVDASSLRKKLFIGHNIGIYHLPEDYLPARKRPS